MIKNRYKFIKKIYKNYIIIFIRKHTFYIPKEELDLLRPFYSKKIKLIDFLNDNHINYLILDNLEIVKQCIFEDNKYKEIKYKSIIYKIYKSLIENLED